MEIVECNELCTGALVVGQAVEAAVAHLLGDHKINDGMERRLVDPEVAGVVEEHAVDADITVL